MSTGLPNDFHDQSADRKPDPAGSPSSLKEHPHGISRQASRRALWTALVILAVLFFTELAGGILAGSLALLSDAAHLLTDVAALSVALFAQWFARRPSSAKRSFGYRRVEIMAALFNGLTLWAVAILISYEAVERLFDPPAVRGVLMLVIAGIGLVAQSFAALVLARASGESLNVRGAYLHALTDAMQSVGVVIAGAVIILTGFVLVDPLISLVIAAMIIWSGWKIAAEAVHVLLEGTPPEIDLAQMAKVISTTPGVCQITDLHAWVLTSGYNALTAHVVSDPSLDAEGREQLCRRLSTELKSRFLLQHTTLQVEESCAMADRDKRCGDWLDPDTEGPRKNNSRS